MTQILPGDELTSTATGFPTGLVGTITVQVTGDDIDLIPLTTSNIVEEEPGTYVATLTIPENAAAGDYRIYWDAHQGYGPILDDTPIEVVDPLAVPWAPEILDLARLTPARAAGRFTGGGADGSLPEFPDEDRVQAIITMATATVASRLGGQHLSAVHWPAAKSLATLRAALTLEPSAWPEQARPDKSAWEQWKQLYDEDLEGLIDTIKNDAADGDSGDGGPEAGGIADPVFSFPSACDDHIPGSELPHPACRDERW